MHRLRLVFGLSLAGGVAMALADHNQTALERHLSAEGRRLQAHFDSVAVELAARDVSRLSVERRRSRAQLAAWLRDYRNASTFPLNDDVSRDAVPIFRDSRGVLCAMAYLIERSGRADIVADLATSRNTASVLMLSDDPRLVAWLDSTGLSLDEAARIQPQYGPRPGDRNSVDANYAIASLALSGTALTTLGVNIVGPSRLSGWVGLVAGTAATLLGAAGLLEASGTRRVGAVNMGVGALSMAMSFRGIIGTTKPRGTAPVTGRLDNIQLAPTVVLLGNPHVGLVLSARF